MGKPRVFLSHSSDKNPTGGVGLLEMEARDATKLALEAAGFEVFLDRDELKAGDRWREVVNGWLGHCDLFVPLIWEKFLASPWCHYELSVGAFRQRMSPRFVIAPIKMMGSEEIKKAGIAGPTQILDEQGVELRWRDELADAALRKAAIDGAVAALVGDLQAKRKAGKIGVEGETPLEKTARRLKVLLGPISKPLAESGAQMLEHVSDGWTLDADPYQALAMRMAIIGLEGARPVLNDLFGEVQAEEARSDLLRVLASAWVDEAAIDAMEKLFSLGPAHRTIATQANTMFTPAFYVWARRGARPSRGWTAMPVAWVPSGGDPQTAREDLCASALAALEKATKRTGAKPVKLVLKDKAKSDVRYFLVLPREGLSAGLLSALRAEFPEVGIFLVRASAQSDGLAETDVAYLAPDVDASLERRSIEDYRSAANSFELDVSNIPELT